MSSAALRLLWVTENYPPSAGGMAESCDRIVRALRGRDVAVDVVHLTRRDRPWKVQEVGGGRLLTCPLEDDPEHALQRVWTALEGDSLSGSLTHVVAFGGTYPLLGAPMYAAWLGLPLITLLRGNDFDTGIFSVRRRALLNDALAASVEICVVARGTATKLEALHPMARTTWIPNGIDAGEWEALPSDRSAAAAWRATEVAPGRRVIGLVGHLKRKKGVLFFLETLLASGRADRFHVVLVGEVEDAVQDWLAANEGALAVTRLPFLDRYALLRYYPAFDLVALPSFYDGLPNVSLEAGALGLPLLSSTAGGLGDVFEHRRHGFLFSPGDVHGLIAALSEAATCDDDLLHSMGEEARKMVTTDLTVDHEADRYVTVFEGTRSMPETMSP